MVGEDANHMKHGAQLLDRYRVERSLGDGAEGGSLLAVDSLGNGRRVVLKRVGAGRADRLSQTFAVLRAAGSPHLPEPLALHRGDADTWLVTGFVEGAALGPGPVPLSSVVSDALGIGRALATLHGLGTHHGDVSANNVVRTPTGGIVLTDFGTLGELGTGTPGFLAPEVLGGGGGVASDLFGLGCVVAWRLFGHVPWRHPEQLVAASPGRAAEVRAEHSPAARLTALERAADVGCPPALRDLLEHLLELDPSRRPRSGAAVVRRLEQIEHALRAGVDAPAVRWAVPRHSNYVGVDLGPTAAALAEPTRPKLVAVAGPPGAGRDRVVAELAGRLATRELEVPVVEGSHAAAALGDPAAALVPAWLGGTSQHRVLALQGRVPWEVQAVAADGADLAETMLAAARFASTTLIVPVTAALGEKLGALDSGQEVSAVVTLRAWSRTQVEPVLATCLRTDDANLRREWIDTIVAATGGWPGAVMRALALCEREGLERPGAEAGKRISAELIEDRPRLEPALARAVIEAHWGLTPETDVPAEVSGPDPRVMGWAVQAAIGSLGGPEVVRALAGAALDAQLTRGARPGLQLCLDAERAGEIVTAAGRCLPGQDGRGPANDDDATLDRLVAWLDRHAREGAVERTSVHVPASVMGRAGAWALARGRVELALRLTRGRAGCEVIHARALHRNGDAAQAHEALRAVAGASESVQALRARALSWRVAVDLGRVAEAANEAREVLGATGAAASAGGLGRLTSKIARDPAADRRSIAAAVAEAALWGGMAMIYAGDTARGRAHVEAAVTRFETGAPGLRARGGQVLGNLALAAGDQHEAAARFRAARDDFDIAGESAVGYLLDGSLAGVAWHLGQVDEAARRARRALGAALARGQHDNVVACFHNLALCLLATGHADLARAELAAVRRAVGLHRPHPPSRARQLHEARLGRIEADLLAARLGVAGRREGAAAYRRAAEALERVGLSAEAADAWLEAMRRARTGGELKAAHDDLERAAALVDTTSPLEVRLGLALSGLAASDDVQSMDAAARRLAGLPSAEALRSAGHLRLAWRYDQTLLGVVRRVHGPGHPRGRAAAHRAMDTLSQLLDEVEPMDRKAALQRLVTEDGDPAPLRALLSELDDDADSRSPTGAGPAPAPGAAIDTREAEAARHLEALLRTFRRLARATDLDRLLEQVVDAVMELTGAERGAVVALTQDGRRLQAARELAGDGDGVQYSSSVIQRVLDEGAPVLSVDASADARFDHSKSISHLNLRSVLAVPLRAGGELLGAAYVDHRLRRGAFTERDLSRVEDFADLAALAVAHARSVQALRDRTEALTEEREQLEARLEASRTELTGLREQVRSSSAQTRNYRGMIGAADAMHRVFRLIDRLADSDVPVVIYGESGTGKELVARAIHDAGGRSSRPFVAENCAAIPETLLESVLFGHARGAFTGAHQARPGLFEAADGGTIFLDELGDMSASMQTKLLRVLQEGEVRRVGENGSRKVDVRVLAASNRNLEALVEAGQFRQDLYYRVCVVKVELPPLRARREDLAPLVEHFLKRHGGAELEVSAAAMRALARYPWPGNVRELENEVQRWVALVEDRVRTEDLAPTIRDRQTHDAADPDDLRLKPRVELLERDLIRQALERTQGNQTQAAQLLGLSRYGLQKKLKRLEEADGEPSDADRGKDAG